MNFESAAPYFEAFSGESATENVIFVETAILRTKAILKDTAYEELPSVQALCGAAANVLYITAKKSREREFLTKSGNLPTSDNSYGVITAAREVYSYFKALCKDYINDTEFYFEGA